MNGIHIAKTYYDKNGDIVKNWEKCAWLIFECWCAPELADQGEIICKNRAMIFADLHLAATVEEEERFEDNGNVYVGVRVLRNA